MKALLLHSLSPLKTLPEGLRVSFIKVPVAGWPWLDACLDTRFPPQLLLSSGGQGSENITKG